MLRWFRKHFQWHPVGEYRVQVDGYRSDKVDAVYFHHVFFMTESGRRKVKRYERYKKYSLLEDRYEARKIPIKIWLDGGPFPQEFIAYEDSLLEIVGRITLKNMHIEGERE